TNNFDVGNNGQAGAADTGLYWYVAGVQLRSDTWPGPIQSSSSPPTATITAPAAGATVSGSAVTVSATASGSAGIAGVQFQVDGTNLGAEDTATPYTTTWNTTTVANGNHTLTAIARDSAGNRA